jgi:hypothetical protein
MTLEEKVVKLVMEQLDVTKEACVVEARIHWISLS